MGNCWIKAIQSASELLVCISEPMFCFSKINTFKIHFFKNVAEWNALYLSIGLLIVGGNHIYLIASLNAWSHEISCQVWTRLGRDGRKWAYPSHPNPMKWAMYFGEKHLESQRSSHRIPVKHYIFYKGMDLRDWENELHHSRTRQSTDFETISFQIKWHTSFLTVTLSPFNVVFVWNEMQIWATIEQQKMRWISSISERWDLPFMQQPPTATNP